MNCQLDYFISLCTIMYRGVTVLISSLNQGKVEGQIAIFNACCCYTKIGTWDNFIV
jgi:hypothetical protein